MVQLVVLRKGIGCITLHVHSVCITLHVHSRDVVFDEDSMPGIQKEYSSKCEVDDRVDAEQANAQSSLNRETDSAADTEHTAKEQLSTSSDLNVQDKSLTDMATF